MSPWPAPDAAVDLLPDIRQCGEHCLHFGAAGHRSNAGAVQAMAGAFGPSRQRARQIGAEVTAAVPGWRYRFDAYGVPVFTVPPREGQQASTRPLPAAPGHWRMSSDVCPTHILTHGKVRRSVGPLST